MTEPWAIPERERSRPDSVRTDSPPLSTVSVPYDFPAARTVPTPILNGPIPAKRRGRRSGALGGVSVVAAIVTVLVEASAIEIATRAQFGLATGLAITSIATSVFAVLAGVVAAVTGRGRYTGIAGAVVGLVANPLVLVVVLDALTRS